MLANRAAYTIGASKVLLTAKISCKMSIVMVGSFGGCKVLLIFRDF